MPLTPAITTTVSITAAGLGGTAVAKIFNNVLFLNFDYFKGTVNIKTQDGDFFFGLTPLTTVTYTIAGTVTTVVIS